MVLFHNITPTEMPRAALFHNNIMKSAEAPQAALFRGSLSLDWLTQYTVRTYFPWDSRNQSMTIHQCRVNTRTLTYLLWGL